MSIRASCDTQHINKPCRFINTLAASTSYSDTCTQRSRSFHIYIERIRVLRNPTSSPEDDPVTRSNDILVNVPPTLRSLTLKRYHLAFYRKYMHTSHIQKLSFVSVQFPNRMDIFIGQCFPKLTTLELGYSSSEGRTWYLSSTSLLVLRLAAYADQTHFDVRVKTFNNESRMYCLRSNTFMTEPRSEFFDLPFKTFPAKQKNIKHGFTLHCHSLSTLFKQQGNRY
jgi:hypothetical protein